MAPCTIREADLQLAGLVDNVAHPEDHAVLCYIGSVFVDGFAVAKVFEDTRVVGSGDGEIESFKHAAAGFDPVAFSVDLVRLD